LARGNDFGDVVVAPGLNKQDVDVWILGQPARDNRTRRTRTTHDEVIPRLKRGGQPGLIRGDPFSECPVHVELMIDTEFDCRV
jgi:hypothetical protein